jgi:uncharacterized protein
MWLGGTGGALERDYPPPFALALPTLIAGSWLGWKSYVLSDEAIFREVVLGLLLASGVALLAARR